MQVQFNFYIIASFGGNNDALAFLTLVGDCTVDCCELVATLVTLFIYY